MRYYELLERLAALDKRTLALIKAACKTPDQDRQKQILTLVRRALALADRVDAELTEIERSAQHVKWSAESDRAVSDGHCEPRVRAAQCRIGQALDQRRCWP